MKPANAPYSTRTDPVTPSWSPPPDGEPWRGERSAPEPDARPYRPPIGIPVPSERRLGSTLLAIGLHVLVILVLLAPVVGPAVLQEVQGAGGPGPAGGGGGGTMGTGGRQGEFVRERLHFVQVAPPTPVPAPVTPPPQKPLPTPVTPPPTPPPVKPETPAPAPEPTPEQTAAAATAPTPGTGGGTGADGTAGSGPGTGGGVGSGIGTGRGAGVGPGTGGGTASVYPPVATELFLPPWPVPDKVKGTQLVANFDVDSTGKVLSFEFTPTKDGGYNRKLKDVLSAVKFRPAVRGDGQPIRAKGSLTYVF
jgi:periplasmic protein TonB